MTVQRVSEIGIALGLLLLCLPVLLVFGLILAIEHTRSPIQLTERVLAGGRRVRLYRLRTAETTPFGSRLTPCGALAQRLHLDNVPALINVLKGDLALMGSDRSAMPSLRVVAERPFS